MAIKEWYAPGSSKNYKTPAGDIKFRIWFEDSAGSSKDLQSGVIKIKPIRFPLEINPSSRTFRFANFNIEFENLNNEFETESIFDLTRDTKTFFDVYVDSQLFFTGIIDYSTIKKLEWYDDNGFLYRRISFNVLDRLAYLSFNSVTLNDISYSNTITLNTLLSNILTIIKVSNIYFDPNLQFDEYPSGGSVVKSYKLKDLYINRQNLTDQVIDFLKNFMVSCGIFIFTLNDTLYIVRRTNGSTISILGTDIIDIVQIEDYDAVSYVKIESTITTDPLDSDYGYLGSNSKQFTDVFSSGTKSNKAKRNFEVNGTGILDQIFSLSDGSQYGPYTAETIDENNLYDTDATGGGSYFHYNNIECGDTVRWGFTGSYYQNISMIKDVPSQTQANFYRLGSTGNYYNAQYDIWRGSGSAGRRYKQYKLVKMAWETYKDYFLTDRAVLKVALKNLKNYQDIFKKYQLNNKNYRIKNATFNFLEDKILLELRNVP